jgi:serine/threonine protein phosphatase PrpC
MTPQSPAITVRIVGATDVGLIREHNEDNYTVLNLETGEVDFSQGRELPLPNPGALLVVCDGMGGAAAGEVASHMAVEVIRRELGPKPTGEAVASQVPAAHGSAGTGESTGSADKSTAEKHSDGGKTGDGLPAVSATDADSPAAEAETAEKAAASSSAPESKAAPTGAEPPQPAEKASEATGAEPAAADAKPATAALLSAATPANAASGGGSGPVGPLSEAQLHGLARKLRQAGQRANQEIYEAACADISKAGMGTTLTCLMLLRSHVIVGQVGDSRAYLCRKGRLTQITHDQSLVNQLLESGQITPEQAKLFEHSNVILQALGVQEDVEVVLSSETVRRGDRLMLCSDGLVGVVSDEEIQEVLAHCEQIEEAVRRLIELARAGGGPDNITVIVAQIDGDGAPAPAETELAEYRVLYLDGEKPPERRMWGSEYAFMTQTSGARDVVGGAAAAPPVSSRLSIISMAAVFALLILGVLGGVLYQPRRPVTPPASGTGAVAVPQPALPPPALPAPASAPAAPNGATAAPLDGGVPPAAAVAPPDAGPVPAAASAAADAATPDAATLAAHEPEDETRPSEATEAEDASKHSKRKKRKKKAAEEASEEPAAPATPPPSAAPPTAPSPASEGGDKPAPEKAPAEKPAAATEKPATEKPAAEKPAAEKPAAEKPAPAAPADEKPAASPAPAN